MTPSAPPLPPFPTMRAALRLTATTGAVAAVAVLALVAAGRAEQIVSALAAAGICLLASLASLDIMRRSVSGHVTRVVLAAMVSFPLRIAVVGAGATLFALAVPGPVLPLVLWTLLFYLVLLAAEVSILVGYLKSATPAADPIAPTLPPEGSARHA